MAMGLHDDATLNINTGYVYLAPVGTAFPGDPADPESYGWLKVGHTSADEIVTIASEGGEKTTLATLQSKALRVSTSAKTTTYGFQLGQFDLDSLQTYYGTTAAVEASGVAAGLLGIPDDPTPAEKAMLILVWDGAKPFGWYAPKASVIGGDDISLADTTALSFMPIEVTPLNYLGATKKVYVLPISVSALAIPNATAVSPTSAAAAATVTITAASPSFYQVTDVKFGATSTPLFKVISPVEIKAVVPGAALTTGAANITVINPAGTDASAVTFTKT